MNKMNNNNNLNEAPLDLAHPHKKEWIKTGDEEINALLPTLSGEEKSYLELITSANYDNMVKNIEKYLGVTPTQQNLPSLVGILYAAANKVRQLEAPHKHQLEELALNTVLNLEEFHMVQEAYINDEVRFQVKLEQPTVEDYKMEEAPEEGELTEEEKLNQELANALDGTNLEDINTRRRLANLLITGGAFSKMFLFHMVEDKLKSINPDLIKIYGALGVIAELGYWMAPDGIESAAASGGSQAGVEEVVPEGDIYIIKAKAISFPYLVHEIVKGIQEYLSLSPEFQKVMDKEKIEDETRNVLAGTEIYKRILAMIPAGKQMYMPIIQKKLISLPTKDAQQVLAQNEDGKRIFNDVLAQAENEWQEYQKNKEEYNQ